MIVRGTTPTIRFHFTDILASTISVAFMTIKQGDLIIEHSLEDAEVGDNYLGWWLTQEETLKIDADKNAEVQLRFKIGINAYASKVFIEKGYKILKGGVI